MLLRIKLSCQPVLGSDIFLATFMKSARKIAAALPYKYCRHLFEHFSLILYLKRCTKLKRTLRCTQLPMVVPTLAIPMESRLLVLVVRICCKTLTTLIASRTLTKSEYPKESFTGKVVVLMATLSSLA